MERPSVIKMIGGEGNNVDNNSDEKDPVPAPHPAKTPLPPDPWKVELPRVGRPFSGFASDVGEAILDAIGNRVAKVRKKNQGKVENGGGYDGDPSNLQECFLCIHHGVFGRILKEPDTGRLGAGLYFQAIDPDMAVTEFERWIVFFKTTIHGDQATSMSPTTAKTLIASPEFRRHLPRVDRIFEYSIPIKWFRMRVQDESAKTDDGESPNPPDAKVEGPKIQEIDDLYEEFAPVVPNEKVRARLVKMEPGFGEYIQPNGEHIYYYCDRVISKRLSLEEAKSVINLLFSEFPMDRQSKIHAVARLLTPHCQGLMGWRKRSPLWVFTANQPRSGKDYLAMLTPLTHSHYANQDPPLETDDEVKRRITAALMSGRRFMHFANCREKLDNPSLEAAVTAEYWTDRIIRSSSEATVPNEMVFSLSYNDNLPMTRDIAARMRVIRLINSDENPNLHEFEMGNLHEMVSTLRSSPMFSVGRAKDISILVQHIKTKSNSVSAYLWGELSAADKKTLMDYESQPPSSKEVQDALLQAIKNFVAGPCIYEERRFEEVKLKDETQSLLDQEPNGPARGQLNSLLIEDAFQLESVGARSLLLLENGEKDMLTIVERLRKHSDPVSLYLWERLPASDKQAMENYRPPRRAPLQAQKVIVEALNKIIKGGCVYEKTSFKEVALSAETNALLKECPTGFELAYLNRLLLEQALPLHLLDQDNPHFSIDEIKDLTSLVARLRKHSDLDRVSGLIWNRLTDSEQEMLAKYQPPGTKPQQVQEVAVHSLTDATPEQVKTLIVNVLNTTIRGPSIHTIELFKGISLRRKVAALLKEVPTSPDDVAYLNRFLLEDAYPQELSQARRLPKVPICRLSVLAALDAFIRKWVDDGCPPPNRPVMASYPEWTRVISGVMSSAGLGNPCVPDDTLVPATYDNWGKELLELVQMVCEEQGKDEEFETFALTDRFITKHPERFPLFNRKIDKMKKASFNSELGQYLMKKTRDSIVTADTLYFIQRDGNRSDNVWRFSKKVLTDGPATADK